MSRLKEQYQNEIVDAMIKKFGYKNIMEVPKLDKIVVNMGVGEAKENAKLLEAAIKDMEAITGPVSYRHLGTVTLPHMVGHEAFRCRENRR